ncbi:hypothetical protein BDN71DRAFT_37893 [Pleurotus eryngii]|uniref:Uncharacterized protein n=1 Tax=Pleurotus eryngii TaxID=5323 RepID=A0A9P6A918_PLEER|nr:hypothetical protein BDN71DRAFT_37893 [Pleurotus eryngii]
MDNLVNLAKQGFDAYNGSSQNENPKAGRNESDAEHTSPSASTGTDADAIKAQIKESIHKGAESLMESTKEFLLAAHESGMKGAQPHLNQAKHSAGDMAAHSAMQQAIVGSSFGSRDDSDRDRRSDRNDRDGRDERDDRDDDRRSHGRSSGREARD